MTRQICVFYGSWSCVSKFTLDVVDKPEIPLADPEVGVVKPVRDLAVDHVPVVADHCPLLEPRALWTLEGHPAAVTVAQVIGLEKKRKRETRKLATSWSSQKDC